MFSTGLTEAETGKVVLKDIDPDAIEMIVKYVYTGTLKVHRNNWEPLIVAANYLQYEQIIDHCCNYLKKHLDLDAIFRINHLSKMTTIPELVHIKDGYINENFEAFSESSGFLELSVEELANIIARDELQMDSELKIFKSIMKWLKYDQDGRKTLFVQLFKKLRLHLINKEDLLEWVANESLIVEDKECNAYLYKALSYHMLPGKRGDSMELWIAKRSNKVQVQVICIVGGELDITNGPMMEMLRMEPFSSTFQHAADNWMYHSTLVRGEYLYIIGGYNKGVVTDRVIAFNLITRSYSDFPSLNVKRYRFATALLNDVMFVCGGKDNHDRILDSVEFYSPTEKKWVMASSMLARRWGHAAVVLNGSIHVVGGQGVKFSERYDNGNQVWTQVAMMTSDRHELGAVVRGGKIYAAGGFSDGIALNSSEFYDPHSSEWIPLSPMKCPRKGLLLVEYQENVYAVGGRNGHENELQSIEKLSYSYCIYQDKCISSWTLLEHKIVIPRWGATVQVVKV